MEGDARDMLHYAVLWVGLLLVTSWASDRLWQLRDVLPPEIIVGSFWILAISIIAFLSIEPEDSE